MQVFAGMDPRLPLAQVPGHAARVERLGYDGLLVPETVHDAFATATLAVEHTQRLLVRTAVVVAFARSPMQVAYAAWSLQSLAGGRFSLGLGTQVRGNIVQRYSMPWSEPTSRMGEYIDALRAIWSSFAGESRLAFEGESYRFSRMQPLFNPGPIDAPAPEVWLGAVNERMVALAADRADGFLAHPTGSHPLALAAVALPALGETPVIVEPPVAAGRTRQDVPAAREHQRGVLAFLHSTPAYRRTLDLLGRGDVADRLHALAAERRWQELPTVVDDDLLDTLVTQGTWRQVAQALAARYEGLVDGVMVTPPADPAADDDVAALVATLREVSGRRAPSAAPRATP